MNNKGKMNRSVQEGIFFFLAGAALLGYAVTSYGKAFNKDWGQSPYLFPIMVAAMFIVLSLSMVREGMKEWRKAAASGQENDGKKAAAAKKHTDNWKGVAVVLILCLVYYAALAYLKIPYITIGIFSFFFTISTFEIATWIFLIVMMGYMGVRKVLVLALVPLGTSLFLSIAFRTFLNVLLP